MANRMGTLYEYDADLKNILRERSLPITYTVCAKIMKDSYGWVCVV